MVPQGGPPGGVGPQALGMLHFRFLYSDLGPLTAGLNLG